MLRFILRRCAAGVVLLVVVSVAHFSCSTSAAATSPAASSARPPPQATVAEGRTARARPAADRPVLRLARAAPARRPRRLLVHRPAGRRGDRRRPRSPCRSSSARPWSPRSSPSSSACSAAVRGGWVDRRVQVVSVARLRHPRLPHRARPGAALRDQPRTGSSRPATSRSRDSPSRLAAIGHAARSSRWRSAASPRVAQQIRGVGDRRAAARTTCARCAAAVCS